MRPCAFPQAPAAWIRKIRASGARRFFFLRQAARFIQPPKGLNGLPGRSFIRTGVFNLAAPFFKYAGSKGFFFYLIAKEGHFGPEWTHVRAPGIDSY